MSTKRGDKPPQEKHAQDNQARDKRAQHGPRSEVNWEGGSGRQPYANQGPEETTESDNHDVPEGNRGESSGRNIEQLDKVKRKP